VGLARDVATQLAAQTVSARPRCSWKRGCTRAFLKDQVASPENHIAGLHALERAASAPPSSTPWRQPPNADGIGQSNENNEEM